ncbi:hypothetical protein IWX48DRAFT_608371 [Phyllosticta citricarpa]
MQNNSLYPLPPLLLLLLFLFLFLPSSPSPFGHHYSDSSLLSAPPPQTARPTPRPLHTHIKCLSPPDAPCEGIPFPLLSLPSP